MGYENKDRKWVRVSRREPCKVCGHNDYCTRSADGTMAHCMRAESTKPAKGTLGGWIHVLAEPLPVYKPREKKQEPKPEIDWTAEAKRMFRASGAGKMRAELAVALGLSLTAIECLRVGVGWDEYRKVLFSSWPERDGSGRVVGIVRRYSDGAKKTMQHSAHGIYYAPDCVTMPGPVFIVEGGSDTAAGLTIGVNVIGRPSNLGGVEYVASRLKAWDRSIVVIAEDDEKPDKKGANPQMPSCTKSCKGCLHCWPGWAGAATFAQRLAKRLRRKVFVRLLPDAKDTRDWLVKHPDASPLDFFVAVNGGPVKLTKRAESKQSKARGGAHMRRRA